MQSMTWMRRLFGLDRPASPKLIELVNLIRDVQSEVDWLIKDQKTLRGRVTGMLRKEKPAEDAPGSTNGEEEPTTTPPKRFAPTAHLARRFRSF